MRKVNSIEDDTPLMPAIVADCVITEIEAHIWPDHKEGLRNASIEDYATKCRHISVTVVQSKIL